MDTDNREMVETVGLAISRECEKQFDPPAFTDWEPIALAAIRASRRSVDRQTVGRVQQAIDGAKGDGFAQARAAIEASQLSGVVGPDADAVFKLRALRTMCEACSQPLYVQIIDEVLAALSDKTGGQS